MPMLSLIPIDGEDGEFSQGNVIKNTLRYTALMASGQDTLKDILTDFRTPKPYQPHPTINNLWVLQVSAEQDEDVPTMWEVEVDYSSELEEREENKNPLARPADITWKSSDNSRIVTTDRRGRPLLNKAGDLFEDETLDDANWVIGVTKNIAKMPRWALNYKHAVNSDTVRIENLTFPPDSLKIKNLQRSERQEENDVLYFVLSFELHHDPNGWTRRILNRGFNAIEEFEVSVDGVTQTKTRKTRILVNGEYPNTPQFLDKKGREIRDEDGNLKDPLEPSDMITIPYELEPRLPFRVLPTK